MSAQSWETTCAKAIRSFNGETPGAELEAEIMAAWEQNHLRVNGAIDRTAALLKAGKVNSGWAVLRAELRKHGPERKKRAKSTRPLGERGFANEAEQLANLERAEQEAEMRARAYVAANRCGQCGNVSLPWHKICQVCKASGIPQASAAGGSQRTEPAGDLSGRTDDVRASKAAAEHDFPPPEAT